MFTGAGSKAGIMNQPESVLGSRFIAPCRSQKDSLAYSAALPCTLRLRNPIYAFVFLPATWLRIFKRGDQGHAIAVIDFPYPERAGLPQFAGKPVYILS